MQTHSVGCLIGAILLSGCGGDNQSTPQDSTDQLSVNQPTVSQTAAPSLSSPTPAQTPSQQSVPTNAVETHIVHFYGSNLSVMQGYIADRFNQLGTIIIEDENGPDNFSLSNQPGYFDYQPTQFGQQQINLAMMSGDQVVERVTLYITLEDNVIVDGYPSVKRNNALSSGYSAFPGETISWHINAKTTGTYTLPITSVNGELVDEITVALKPQQERNDQPWYKGFGYDISFDYAIDSQMASGVYFIGADKSLMFVVKSREPGEIVVVLPTNTMNAYSCSADHGLYDCPTDSQPVAKVHKVSFLRPITNTTGSDSWENYDLIEPMLKWLDKEQSNRNISYITDYELDNLDNYASSQLMVIPGHNEYWTHKAKENFDIYTQQLGKNAFVAGGNIMWWAVRYEDNGRTLVTYKHDEDIDAPSPELRTTLFNTLQKSALHSIGGSYTFGGIDVNQVDSRFNPNSMRMIQPNSIFMRNSGLGMCDELDLSPNAEFDGAPVMGFNQEGFPVVDITSHNIHKLEILGYTWGAQSYNHRYTMGTTHVFQKTAESGYVFQFGSMGAGQYGFTNHSHAAYRQVATNVLDVLTSDQSPFSTAASVQQPSIVKFRPPQYIEPGSFYEHCRR
ncbi:MAG: hypothetical protein ACI8WB_002288 [Phenylobacterium sp.]|jgi:hypothetical protein